MMHFHFRVNIMPPGRNSNCQTLSACTTDLGSLPTEPTEPITVATPVVSTSTVAYSATPSPSRMAKVDDIISSLLTVNTIIIQCLKTWPCTNARQREICCSDGNSYPTRCHMRRQECLYNVDLDVLHRGPCLCK